MIFNNLLSNAIKFSRPDVPSKVRVWADKSSLPNESFVKVFFQDNGIGIARENLHKIFGAFQRLHPSEKYPGTGIGLAIVRKGIERMGGSVGLESEPGKGSTFWIELPAPTTETPEDQ